VLKPSQYVPSYGGKGFGQIVITFIVAKKAYFTVYFALFTVYVGGWGWLKTSYGGEG